MEIHLRFSLSWVSLFLSAAVLTACATESKHSAHVEKPVEVGDEVSLRADRSDLDELRKDIPEDVRKDNDEIALVLQMMTSEGRADPGTVRDKFNTAVRKRREKNDKILRRKREDFTKVERKAREDFLKSAKKERDDFMRRKRSSDARKEFFEGQDQKRREFFADQQDKRRDFESDMNEERKTFEDYMREQTNRFNQEHRDYTTAYYERKKNEDLKKRMEEKGKRLEAESRSAGEDAGFEETPNVPTTPLMPPDDGK